MRIQRLVCWWAGCKPVWRGVEHAPNHSAGTGVMPCGRCGAPDTSYEDRAGMTRLRAAADVPRLLIHLLRPTAPCMDCGRRGGDHGDCDTLPF